MTLWFIEYANNFKMIFNYFDNIKSNVKIFESYNN